MSDAYLVHLEIADVVSAPHGKIHGYDVSTTYGEIAAQLARRTIISSKATITTIVKRPDGRVIMLRREWSDDDLGEHDEQVLDVVHDERPSADETARDAGGSEDGGDTSTD